MDRASADHKTEYLEPDVRPGGRYGMKTNFRRHLLGHSRVSGDSPSRKAGRTWAWTKTPSRPGEANESGPTIVTVEFFSRGGSTEVVLTHEGFTSSALRDRHELGWKGCFETLERFLQA